MAFVTWEDTVSDGVQTTYNIIFPYLSQDHVSVYFNGVAQPSSSYSFPNTSQIQLVTPASNGVTVRVGRDTPNVLITDFQTMVTEGDLDNAYLHMLYRTQELQDKWDDAVAAAVTVVVGPPTHNLSAIVKPGVTDDSDAGYSIGSLWWVTGIGGSDTDGLLYQASDVTVGAAVWEIINRRSVTNATPPNANHDYEDGFTVGDTWWDSAAGVLYVCTDNSTGAAVWGSLSPSSISYPLTHTGLVHIKQGADLASATNVNLAAATGNHVRVTGTTTVATLGTVAAGSEYELEIVSGFTFTHSASLECPNDEDLVTEAGDFVKVRSYGSNVWKITNYEPHSKRHLAFDNWVFLEDVSGTNVASKDITNINTNYPDYDEFRLVMTQCDMSLGDREVYIRLDVGSGFETTNYKSRGQWQEYSTGAQAGGTQTTGGYFLGHTSSNWGIRSGAYPAGIVFGEAIFYNCKSIADHVSWRYVATYRNHGGSETASVTNMNRLEVVGRLNGIRLLTGAGSPGGGTPGVMTITGKLYGRKVT